VYFLFSFVLLFSFISSFQSLKKRKRRRKKYKFAAASMITGFQDKQNKSDFCVIRIKAEK